MECTIVVRVVNDSRSICKAIWRYSWHTDDDVQPVSTHKGTKHIKLHNSDRKEFHDKVISVTSQILTVTLILPVLHSALIMASLFFFFLNRMKFWFPAKKRVKSRCSSSSSTWDKQTLIQPPKDLIESLFGRQKRRVTQWKVDENKWSHSVEKQIILLLLQCSMGKIWGGTLHLLLYFCLIRFWIAILTSSARKKTAASCRRSFS